MQFPTSPISSRRKEPTTVIRRCRIAMAPAAISAVISDIPDTRISANDIPNAKPISRLAIPGDDTPVLTTKDSNTPNDTMAPPTSERTRKLNGCEAFSTAISATLVVISPMVNRSHGSRVPDASDGSASGVAPLVVSVDTGTVVLQTNSWNSAAGAKFPAELSFRRGLHRNKRSLAESAACGGAACVTLSACGADFKSCCGADHVGRSQSQRQ